MPPAPRAVLDVDVAGAQRAFDTVVEFENDFTRRASDSVWTLAFGRERFTRIASLIHGCRITAVRLLEVEVIVNLGLCGGDLGPGEMLMKRKLARARGSDQLSLCGAAGNRTRPKNQLDLPKQWNRRRETTRNNLDRPADTPTELMASTRHQHQGLVSHSLRRVRTSVDALMVTAAKASAWT